MYKNSPSYLGGCLLGFQYFEKILQPSTFLNEPSSTLVSLTDWWLVIWSFSRLTSRKAVDTFGIKETPKHNKPCLLKRVKMLCTKQLIYDACIHANFWCWWSLKVSWPVQLRATKKHLAGKSGWPSKKSKYPKLLEKISDFSKSISTTSITKLFAKLQVLETL